MAKIVNSRCVLAVRDLKVSTRYYIDVLGFKKDPIDAEGWSFLTRDTFRVMLGECADERPASELGNHSYFAYWNVEGVDRSLQRVRGQRRDDYIQANQQTLGPQRIRAEHPRRPPDRLRRNHLSIARFPLALIYAD